MNNSFIYILAVITGLLGGIVFFGGLRFTLKKIPFVKRPALFALLSFWFRLLFTGGAAVLVAVLFGWQSVLFFAAALITVKVALITVEKRKVAHDKY